MPPKVSYWFYMLGYLTIWDQGWHRIRQQVRLTLCPQNNWLSFWGMSSDCILCKFVSAIVGVGVWLYVQGFMACGLDQLWVWVCDCMCRGWWPAVLINCGCGCVTVCAGVDGMWAWWLVVFPSSLFWYFFSTTNFLEKNRTKYMWSKFQIIQMKCH
jgi:hypothetical protein